MIFRYLYIYIMILFSLPVLGQQVNKHMTYKRMEGSTDTTEMKANLVRQFDQISGNYEISTTANTITYDMTGNIDKNDHITLSPYGTKTPALEGVFVDHKFTGIWNENNESAPINLTEAYPPGSIPLDVCYLHSEESLFPGNPESPTAEIELTMLYPVLTPNVTPGTIENIRKIIAEKYIDKPGTINPDSILIAAEQNFYDLYKDMDTTDWQDMTSIFSWTQENNMSVIYNSDGILSLEYVSYVYTGGAHGMTVIRHDIIDIKTGVRMTFNKIFKNNVKEQLSTLLTAQLRQDKAIPDSVSLEDAYYFVSRIDPTDNIYVNGSGVGFSYASYEIAPYSMGITQILLPYRKIKDLLRQDTRVRKLAGQ